MVLLPPTVTLISVSQSKNLPSHYVLFTKIPRISGFCTNPTTSSSSSSSSSSKLGRVAGTIMKMGVSAPCGSSSSLWFSSQRFHLLGGSSSSPKPFQRRCLHGYDSTNDPSSSTIKFGSSSCLQRNSRPYYRPLNKDVDVPTIAKGSKTIWEPVVSEHRNGPTSSLPQILPYGPIPDDSELGSIWNWDQESERVRQLKQDDRERRKFNLEEYCHTKNSSFESGGSQDGGFHVKESFSDLILNSPKLNNVKANGQSQPLCQTFETSHNTESVLLNGGGADTLDSHMMVKCLGKMNLVLKEDIKKEIRPNGLNKIFFGTAQQKPAYEAEIKSDVSKNPKEDLIDPHKNLSKEQKVIMRDPRENLSRIYDEVLVVNNIQSAKKIVELLTTKYRSCIHACDTEVAKIDVKQETPVDHGEIICFSIYSGPNVDFGNGKSCIWVDVLDGGGKELVMEFAPFFEDSSIKKVWHNYSFDSHVIENYGIKISGFHADTMHMARLWNSSRRTEGGYSLEALTSDPKVMNGAPNKNYKNGVELIGKISMKTIFGKKKLKRDGSEGKLTTIAPVEELQREERKLWICYSALDSMSTLQLFESLQSKLKKLEWVVNGRSEGIMYEFYEKYWRPFGELLVKMETEGMLVDCAYLAEIQKVATLEQQIAANRFRKWATRYCPDAVHMNVGSDAQLRQLFFGGAVNSKDPNEALPETRSFKVPNIEQVIEEGKKVPLKFRNITIRSIGVSMETELYTPSGWPSVSGDALKALAGKVSSEYDWIDDLHGFESDIDNTLICGDGIDVSNNEKQEKDVDVSSYGTAYKAFGEEKDGKDACHAIAALCEVCSIDSLISNFILPLQSNRISGKHGRIHCSLNINTETGRLSARRPNLQNQPALEKDRYKIRQAFIAAPGNSLIVADYGQLELRILAHLADCKSMKYAFKAGGDFHSRTAMNMYSHIREAVEKQEVLLEWHPQTTEDKPPVPLLKDAFASERRKAKMLNFSIAYGKTPVGLARDWKVSVKEAKATVDLWYHDRKEVLTWQEKRKEEANRVRCVKTLLGRTRSFPSMRGASKAHQRHIERAAINTPVQGSAADVAMCAMLEISKNARLEELGWRLLLQVHDEVILEGPSESAEVAKAIVVECMSKPFNGKNILSVDLSVDAKCAQNWYAGK